MPALIKELSHGKENWVYQNCKDCGVMMMALANPISVMQTAHMAFNLAMGTSSFFWLLSDHMKPD